jgi:hypothetical protein
VRQAACTPSATLFPLGSISSDVPAASMAPEEDKTPITGRQTLIVGVHSPWSLSLGVRKSLFPFPSMRTEKKEARRVVRQA